jgi:hypothetical protein
MWEKALHRWVSAKARLSTLCAGVVADAHTMFAINVVQLAVLVKLQLLDGIIGVLRLCKDKESAKLPKLTSKFNFYLIFNFLKFNAFLDSKIKK